MGNGLRHSLGHMCGGQAGKDCPEDEAERPVDKTNKKKTKKNKKQKKVRNKKLTSIKEESEVQDDLHLNGNSELPSGAFEGKANEGINYDESQKLGDGHEDESEKHEEFLEEKLDKDRLHINDESLNVPKITVDCPPDTSEKEVEKADEVSSDNPISDSCINNEERTIDRIAQYNNEGDNISLLSTTEEEPSIIVCSFKPVIIETLGIKIADDIFKNAFNNYEMFVSGAIKFQETVSEFQQLVEPEKRMIDFLALWHMYKSQAEELISKDSEDKIDLSSYLKAVESAGVELIELIENVIPILNKCTDDANNIDAIEYVKDQMLVEEELTTMDKFSVPGKYRHNLNLLKKSTKQILGTELETNEILRCLQIYFHELHHEIPEETDPLSLACESIIIPEEKSINKDLEDLFSNLSQESIPIVMSGFDGEPLTEDHEERPLTPLPTNEVQVSPDDLTYVPNDSHSDHDEDEVYLYVQFESDDNCLDSIQVSKEISNCMELDFDIISPNIQVIESIEKDNVEDASELRALPQVHSDIVSQKQPTYKMAGIRDMQEVILVAGSPVELECVPDIPLPNIAGTETPVESILLESNQSVVLNSPDIKGECSALSNSLSYKSYNALTVELDLSCDSEGSSVNIEYQILPLSEDIIGPTETDDETWFSDMERKDIMSDHCDKFEHCNDYSEHDLEIINRSQSVLGQTNQSDYEEIWTASVELPEVSRSHKVVFEIDTGISYEQCIFDMPSLDYEIENANQPTSGRIDNVEPLNTDLYDEETSSSTHEDFDSLTKANFPSKIDSPIESMPHLLTVLPVQYCFPDKNESGIVISGTEYEEDGVIQVTEAESNGDKQLHLSDSSDGSTKEIKEQDVAVPYGNSMISPVTYIPNCNLVFDELYDNDISDSECYSDTTSIQEIQLFPTSQSVNSPFKTSDAIISENAILHSEPSLSDKGINDTEVEVALKVLQVAIENDNVQDEYVGLLCSSISRVLGNEDEKTATSRLKSIESSYSSYEENSLHKSFQLSKEVFDWVGTHFQSDEYLYNGKNNVDDKTERCIIVPVEKGSVHSPHIISHTIFKSEKHPIKYGDLVKTVNVSVEDITADEGMGDALEDEKSRTFVIKSVPETSEAINVLLPQGSPPLHCHTPPCELDTEPDHNTLDYGNYVFVDPSTGDIQVMRNRSRSLDSLVSMTSSRSSISRFGSFEFVTDFEINIAEKNQGMMKEH